MKVFVAGATGALGRRLVPALIEGGHEVSAITRSPERAERLRAGGVEAAVGDALDGAAVDAAIASARPEAIVNELTDLPPALKPRKLKRYYAANDTVRREGSRNLIAAAEKHGVRRIVTQGVAFWYAPEPRGLASEGDPLYTAAPDPIGRAVATMKEVEGATLAAAPEAVVLRYGFFYGPGTWYSADGDVGKQVGARRYPVIGKGEGVFSFVHVDDAAAATVAALTAPPGVYNVVDDEPVPLSVWLPELAEALGAKPPMKVPRAIAVVAAGRAPVVWMEQLRGVDNAKAKRELGWTPRYPSWRDGFREGLDPSGR